MTTNKGIADSIINGGEEDLEEEEGEEVEEGSIAEEFQALSNSVEEIQQDFMKKVNNLQGKNSKAGVTRGELALLYGELQGNVLDVLKDFINATGNILSEIADEADDEEDDEGDEDDIETPEIEDDTVQVYTTLLANGEAFRKISERAEVPDDLKELSKSLLKMNEDSIALFETQYDPELLKQRASSLMEQARAQS